MIQNTEAQPMRVFFAIWFGQLISLIGSGLSAFSIGVWVYQQTGSATEYALINLFIVVPRIVLVPIAGVLADRWDRRRLMILSDTGAALGTVLMAILLASGNLPIIVIYIVTMLSSIFNAFQYPAYSASVTLLVPQEKRARANGMIQFADAAQRVLAPLLAGVLVATIGLQGILMIDLVTFAVAVSTLLLVRIPQPVSANTSSTSWKSLINDGAEGLRYITARPGLFGVLLFYTVINLSLAFVHGLFTPLILRFTSSEALGLIMAIGSAGLLLSTFAISVWGIPRPAVLSLISSGVVFGVCIMLFGLQPSVVFITVVNFIFFLCHPVINSANMLIWQNKIPADLQGRAFATLRLVGWSSAPFAFIAAGPLADRVFEPLLAEGGALAGSLGPLIGVGPGRGIALLLIIMGLLPVIASVIAYLYRPIRQVDQDLPDIVVTSAPAGT